MYFIKTKVWSSESYVVAAYITLISIVQNPDETYRIMIATTANSVVYDHYLTRDDAISAMSELVAELDRCGS